MKNSFIPYILLILGLGLLGWSFMPKSTSGELDIDVVKTTSIMPAAHNVYANQEALDGKYYLFKSKITNNTNQLLEDVTVKYRIPGYIEWTEIDIIGEMKIGQTASVCCYPKFKDDICEKMTESMEKVEIEITWDGAEEDDVLEEDFAFRISGRNEYKFTNIPNEEIMGWADVYNNDALLACYVTPDDPIVKYYTQNIQEKILMGETAGATKNPTEAVRFLAGIYNATLLSHMVYSSTKGTPSSITDYSKFSQQNRLPREVITGNTGLCLELSLLYASILSNAGIDPIIYLVPGHAYPGFKMNNEYYAIEATSIGGEGLGSIKTAEEAFETGQKELSEFIKAAQNGDPRYTIVDVHALNLQGVTPMALKDDEFLRKKVDDIVASWSGQPTGTQDTNPVYITNNTYVEQPNTPVNPVTPVSTSVLSFSQPSGWQTVMYPVSNVPILTAQVVSPDYSTTVTVYDIPTNNSQDAMNLISEYMAINGMTLQYQINGSNISGMTMSYEGNFAWIGKVLNVAGGKRVVAVGSYDYMYDQNSGIINQVYNSIH